MKAKFTKEHHPNGQIEIRAHVGAVAAIRIDELKCRESVLPDIIEHAKKAAEEMANQVIYADRRREIAEAMANFLNASPYGPAIDLAKAREALFKAAKTLPPDCRDGYELLEWRQQRDRVELLENIIRRLLAGDVDGPALAKAALNSRSREL